MRWSSAGSTAPRLEAAIDEVGARIHADLDGARPDVAMVFVTPQHAAGYERVPRLVRHALDPGVIVGCSANGVVGGGHELEEQAGVSLTAAVLPDVRLTPLRLETPALPSIPAAEHRGCLLVPDPFSFQIDALLPALDERFPGSTVVGGLASGARAPGGNVLWLDDTTHRDGAVGLALAGDLAIDTIVAQGCRPVGEPMFVTRCEGNLLYDLDDRRATVVLQHLFTHSSEADRALFRHSLFLGVAMRDAQQEYRQGDFLIRNVLGADERGAAIAIGGQLRRGMIVQFHLRDALTSAQDLDALLGAYAERRANPAGALLFSCLGRGRHLYGRADHDTDAVRRHLGAVPLGGLFCNGEIGPVHGTTFLHGYTSAFGLFRPR